MGVLSTNIVENWISLYQPKILFIAYSGGVDSSVLLHITAKLKKYIKIHALHVNHGLNHNANVWESYTREQSRALGIGFTSTSLSPPKKKVNLEHWARERRYDFFTKVINKHHNPLLFTGHHMDDQAETFLLQGLRGSGLRGLSSIIEDQKFGCGRLIRPLLNIRKVKLEKYCRNNSITWIEDSSNTEYRYTRNIIRHEILTRINKIRINASKTLARSARWCQETQHVLDDYLNQDLRKISYSRIKLSANKLREYSDYRKKILLHYWLRNHSLHINHIQLEQVAFGLNSKKSNLVYHIKNGRIEINFSFLTLIVGKCEEIGTCRNDKIDNIFTWIKRKAPQLDTSIMSVRERRGNDRCKYPGRQRKQRLKVLFQELKIPTCERGRVKIICRKSTPQDIIALYPFFVCS